MKSILIIDDDYRIRHIYNKFLEMEGYMVFEAQSADSANEIIKTRKIDLVLLDLRMPEVDGVVFYDVIRAFHKQVKIFVSSVFPVYEQKHMVPGADGYFDKTSSIPELVEKIKEILADETVEKNTCCRR